MAVMMILMTCWIHTVLIEEATYHPVLWVTMTCKRRNKGLVTFGDMQTGKMGGYTQQLQVYTHRCAVMGWWVNKSLKPERDGSRGGGLPKLRATLTQQCMSITSPSCLLRQ